MTPDRRDFGELQLAILRVLWERGEASVRDVREALAPDREPAVSTVATVLSRLEEQDAVSHRKEGRRYVYRAELGRDEVRRSMVGELLDRLFGGEPTELVGHLLRQRDLDGADLDRLRELVESEGS